jgi:predicted dehydrogenase
VVAQEDKAVLPPAAREYRIAFIGLRYYITWRFLSRILEGQGGPVKLVGIAETEPELIAEAKRRGATEVPVYADYHTMLDEAKPDIVWGFLENNRHLEVMQACAPRKIHVIYQKPLAATYRDALAIRALAQTHGIQVLTHFDIAFYPTTYAAKAKADSGEIGKVWRLHGIEGHGGMRNRPPNGYFFRWLIDPVQSGAGALIDFGSYNALWALWYKGRPESVYATALHLRPDEFPKVEDSSVMVLSYKDGVGIFEGSWDLPRSFQQLEVFGLAGSLQTRGNVEVALRKGSEWEAPQPEVKIEVPALAPEMAGPTEYLAYCLMNKQPVEGMVALDINVGVIEVIEAAKLSIKTGKAVALPLPLK